jgi:uncharacterized protein
MVVGVLRLRLLIPAARSLKEKRHALRRIVDRVRARYNVSIAEVGDNDIWQRAVVGITAVANDHSFVNEVLDKVVRDVEMLGVADLVSREMEIETYSEMHERAHDHMLRPSGSARPPGDPSVSAAAERSAEEREEAEALAEYLREEDLP